MSKRSKDRKPKKGKATPSTVQGDWWPGFGTIQSTTSDWKPRKNYAPCHESHPTLKLGKGEVLGASCNHPRAGFDVYVGLDHGMERRPHFPWAPSQVVEVYFPVTDGGVPKDVAQYIRMVDWLIEQLEQGKRIHMGCIGGHGRTGTLLAALISRVHGDSDAGEWVRKNYCKSAIETTTQIKFLQEHFGISPVAPSKESWGTGSDYSFGGSHQQRLTYSPLRGRSLWNEALIEYGD